ncbi:MAG TPA: methyl-accepting chemotaxis protein [Ktedonobacteraceae bacterium]|nr:methyl-accepting chemotaxis protein [Ktedonobacteraceae bacterium]
MIKFLSNIPIFRRLFIAFAIAAAIPAVIIVLLGNFYLTSLNQRGQAVSTSFDSQRIASQQQTNLQSMHALLEASQAQVINTLSSSLNGVVQDSSLSASVALTINEVLARQATFDQVLPAYQQNYQIATSSNMAEIQNILLGDNPNTTIIRDQRVALTAVSTIQWPTYKKLQTDELTQLQGYLQELQNGHKFTPKEINQAYENTYSTWWNADQRFTGLRNSWQLVVDTAITTGKTVSSVGPSQTQSVLIATVLAIVISLLIVFTTGWIINLTITQPLRRLASLTRRITRGDTNARAKIIGRDEINLVASSMNNMLDNIVRLIQGAQAQRDNLQTQVEKLVSEVSGVGEGDLRVQAEVTADTLGVLADSFNYMVEELGSLVVRVKMVAHEVESSTTMTYERMSQLVEVADTQIKQITGAAIEVEKMADSSRQVAERAQVLYGVAREARQTAETGRGAVQQTVEGMGRIHEYVQDTSSKVQTLGDRSREINNIVEVIANIAHQTNRLALDAAIQAAMAGENGKGFGAVAADIRRLAERAKDQAGSIARIVRGVREDIGAVAVSMRDTERETSAGSQLAQEAGTSLESIFGVVERQASEIEAINRMAAQQLQSSSAVVQIMQTVSDSTQQSSASTRDAAQNMERVARLAEQLLASVEAFKLRENLNYYAPMGNVTITPEEEYQNQLSISGAFRTVTSSAQSSNNNALAPARTTIGPFSPYPMTPYQQSNGMQSQPQWPVQSER